MRFRLSTWRPAHLLMAWCIYWIGLALGALAPMLPTLWRVTRPGARGSVSASVDNGVAHLIVTNEAATVWTGHVSLSILALWLALPPLVLWVLWLRAQRRPASATAAAARGRPIV